MYSLVLCGSSDEVISGDFVCHGIKPKRRAIELVAVADTFKRSENGSEAAVAFEPDVAFLSVSTTRPMGFHQWRWCPWCFLPLCLPGFPYAWLPWPKIPSGSKNGKYGNPTPGRGPGSAARVGPKGSGRPASSVGIGALTGRPFGFGTPAGGGKTMGTKTPEEEVEVVLTGTRIVSKPVGLLTLVMVLVRSADSVLDADFGENGGSDKTTRALELVVVFLTGRTEKAGGISTLVTVLDPRALELVVVFLMGTTEKGGGISMLVTVLDPSCDFSIFDWDLENGAGRDADLTGELKRPVGV